MSPEERDHFRFLRQRIANALLSLEALDAPDAVRGAVYELREGLRGLENPVSTEGGTRIPERGAKAAQSHPRSSGRYSGEWCGFTDGDSDERTKH